MVVPGARHSQYSTVANGFLVVDIARPIIGNCLWNYASRALPLSLMGQMIVSETIFAALYGFLWEKRWPTPAESAALVLLVGGVVSCAAVHRAPAAA